MNKFQKREFIATVFVISAAFCWGLIGYFSRPISGKYFSSVQLSMLRSLITLVVLCLIIFLFDKEKFKVKIRDFWIFIASGVFSIAFFNICYFISIEKNTLSLAAILLYTAPSFVMIMSYFIFKEKITKQKWIALILSFLGLFFAVGILGGEIQTSILGLLVGLGSGFGYALYSIFSRIALKKYHCLTVTIYTFLIATICLIPFSEPYQIIETIAQQPKTIFNLLALGIVSTLMPFLLYTKGLENLEVGKASLLTFVEPVVATLVGVIAFKEKMTIFNISGIILIISSIMILNIKPNVKGRLNVNINN